MATVSVTELTAIDLRESLVSGETQIEPFVDQHWEFVADLDAQVNAFCSFDKEVVTAQASDLLAQRSRPQPLGSLYGVPIGIKDIIDTVDYPTAYGSAIHQGRYPVVDATIVRRLKHAGALIFGKTVTTEFATFVPGPTRNPHNLEHTPGVFKRLGCCCCVRHGACGHWKPDQRLRHPPSLLLRCLWLQA